MAWGGADEGREQHSGNVGRVQTTYNSASVSCHDCYGSLVQ